jgi:hypothetical protein
MIIPEVMKNLNKDIKEFCDRLYFKYSPFSDMDIIANIVYSGMLTYSSDLRMKEEFDRIDKCKYRNLAIEVEKKVQKEVEQEIKSYLSDRFGGYCNAVQSGKD